MNRRFFLSMLAGAAGAPARDRSFLELLQPYVESWKRTVDGVNRRITDFATYDHVTHEWTAGEFSFSISLPEPLRPISARGFSADEEFLV